MTLTEIDVNAVLSDLNKGKLRLSALIKMYTKYSKGEPVTKGDLLNAGYKTVIFSKNGEPIGEPKGEGQVVHLDEYPADFEVKKFYYKGYPEVNLYIELKS